MVLVDKLIHFSPTHLLFAHGSSRRNGRIEKGDQRRQQQKPKVKGDGSKKRNTNEQRAPRTKLGRENQRRSRGKR